MPEHGRLLPVAALILTIAAAAVFAGCTSSSNPGVTPSPASTVAGGTGAITIQNFTFSPTTLTVPAGSTVTWTNLDTADHAIASDSGSPVSFFSSSLPQGGTFRFTFTSPGTYSYHCSIHPSMKGTVVVT